MQAQRSDPSDTREFMLRQASAWLIAVDENLVVTAWNQTAQSESGFDRDEFSTLPELLELLIPESENRMRSLETFGHLGTHAARATRIETAIVTRRGEPRTLSWSIDFLPLPDVGSALAVAVGVDITDRLAGASALKQNESIHRLLLESLQEGIWWIDEAGRTLYANGRLARIIGVHAAEVVGKPIQEYLPIGTAALRSAVSEESELRRTDGSVAYVHVAGAPLVTDVDGAQGALLSIVDLSDQRRLSEEHALLAQAVAQASESIVITDAEATIRYINPAFTRITGYSEEEAVGQNHRILQSGEHDPSLYEELWARISSGKDWKGVFRNRRKDGSVYSEEESISPVRGPGGNITGYIRVKRDVTRELELQEYLQANQKLQAIGTLAGGVAHDFNNILMAILGYAELALAEAEADSVLAGRLDHVISAARRAHELSDQLLTFSRGSSVDSEPADFVAGTREAIALLRVTTPGSITISEDLPDLAPRVSVGRTEVVQIVMNLGLNAVAAVDRDVGGTVRIEVGCEQAPDPTLLLTVSDDGVGMDTDTVARVFEPFFSTRAVGQGTGMGLAVVHGIVTGCGGTIRVDSTPGRGSSFAVRLPMVEACERGHSRSNHQEEGDE